MPKHRHFRHGSKMHHSWSPFGGLFWLFLLGFFFMGDGGWWPGILILIGLCMVFGGLFRDESPQRPRDLPPVQRPATPPTPTAPTVAMTATPVEPAHRTDLLPAACPQCGGPVNLQDVRWTGKQSAACAYCGSALTVKKA